MHLSDLKIESKKNNELRKTDIDLKFQSAILLLQIKKTTTQTHTHKPIQIYGDVILEYYKCALQSYQSKWHRWRQ